jgi:hypothetical protein
MANYRIPYDTKEWISFYYTTDNTFLGLVEHFKTDDINILESIIRVHAETKGYELIDLQKTLEDMQEKKLD